MDGLIVVYACVIVRCRAVVWGFVDEGVIISL